MSFNFLDDIRNFNIYQFLIPIIVVMPFTTFIDKIVRTPKDPRKYLLVFQGFPCLLVEICRKSKPSCCRKYLRIVGIVLAIILSIGSILIALIISIGMGDLKQQYWGVYFAQAIMQDTLFSPVISLVLNSLCYFIIVKKNTGLNKCRKRLRNMTMSVMDENYLVAMKCFNQRPRRRPHAAQVNLRGLLIIIHNFFTEEPFSKKQSWPIPSL